MTSFHSHSRPFSAWHGGLLLLSAAAAATAVWVHDKARQAERDHPPAGRYMHIDGVRLHYLERGTGPVVALLHGNAFHGADMMASGLVEQLARDHRVIVFDRPGFGHSTRPRDRLWTPQAQAALLHRALVALGADRPVVVGHSYAALVALAMALDFPTSVAGLVLLSGYYYPSLRVDSLMMAPVATPVLGDAMRYTVSPMTARLGLKRATQAAFSPRAVPPGYLEEVPREMLVRPVQLRADAEDAAFMLAQARSLSPRYAQLPLPVAVIAGDGDRVVDTNTQSRRLAAELPNSRLRVLPGVGHMTHHAAPQAIAEELAAVQADARKPRTAGALSEAAALVQLDALPGVLPNVSTGALPAQPGLTVSGSRPA